MFIISMFMQAYHFVLFAYALATFMLIIHEAQMISFILSITYTVGVLKVIHAFLSFPLCMQLRWLVTGCIMHVQPVYPHKEACT